MVCATRCVFGKFVPISFCLKHVGLQRIQKYVQLKLSLQVHYSYVDLSFHAQVLVCIIGSSQEQGIELTVAVVSEMRRSSE